jgi:hypothetical protein
MGGLRFLHFRVLVQACATLFLTMLSRVAYAAPDDPYQTAMKMYGVYSIGTAEKSAGKDLVEREIIPEVRLTGRIRGEGNLDVRFSIRRNKTWASFIDTGGRSVEDPVTPVLLQGRLALGRGWRKNSGRLLPGAASIIGKELRLSFPGRVKGSRHRRQRIYTVKMALDGSLLVNAHVASIPVFLAKRGACGANVEDTIPAADDYRRTRQLAGAPMIESSLAPYTSNAQQARIVAISTDADPEWYAKYGENSNAVIAAIINAAEALYDRQLGVRFKIVAQHVYAESSPYVSTDPGYLLTEFVTNPANASNLGVSTSSFRSDVDLSHLFTGKDFDGGVVGIAYIGVVCSAPALSYGVTQSYLDVAMPGIFAHEIGHNFGAQHDMSDRSGLMYPSISVPPSDRFSDATVGQINDHLAQFDQWLSTEAVESKTYGSFAPSITSPGGSKTPIPVPSAAPAPQLPVVNVVTLQKQRVGARVDPVVRLYGIVQGDNGGGVPETEIQLVAGGRVVAEGASDKTGAFQFFLQVEIPRNQRISAYVRTMGQGPRSDMVLPKRTLPVPSRSAERYRRKGR